MQTSNATGLPLAGELDFGAVEEKIADLKENKCRGGFDSKSEIKSWEDESEEETMKYSDFEPESDDDPNCYKPAGEAWEKRKKKLIKYFGEIPTSITWEKVRNRYRFTKHRYFKGKVEEVEERTFFTRVATTPAQKLLYLLHLIYHQMEVRVCEHVPVAIWKKCLQNGLVVLDILEMYPNIVFDSSVGSSLDTQKGADYKGNIGINFWSMIEMYSAIYNQFHAGLLSIIPRTKIYYKMFECEHMLFVFAQNCLQYFKKRSEYKAAAKVALGLVELVYYKTQSAYMKMQNEHAKCLENGSVEEEEWPIEPVVVIPECVPRQATFPENSTTFINDLLPLIKKHGNEQTRTHAILFEIHHHAIMDHFSESEELLLTSKMQDKVELMDITTERHFYRAVAQLGLCAFRSGSIEVAFKYLSQVYAGGGEQALGQAVSRKPCKPLTPTDEIYERRKLSTYHLRISSNLLQFVHKVCLVVLKDPADLGVVIRDNKWKKLESMLFAKLQEAIADTNSAPSPIDTDRYAMVAHLSLGIKRALCNSKNEQIFGDRTISQVPPPDQCASGRDKVVSVPPGGDAPSPPPEESDEESDDYWV